MGRSKGRPDKRKVSQASALREPALTGTEAASNSSNAQARTLDDQQASNRSRRYFRPRTLTILIILLIPLSYLSYRSVIVYRLRSFAWEAAELREAGRWRALENVASQWARWDPDVALPWLLAAEGAERQGSKERVAGYLEQVPASDPRTPALLLELATLYFGELNNPQQAIDTVHRALKIEPANPEAHRRLIFYYGITLQRLQMIRQSREAIQLGADSQETYVYLMGANWLTFSNAYELNNRWMRSGQNLETYSVAEVLHARGSLNLLSDSEPIEEVEADRVKRLEHIKLLEQYLERFPENIELLTYFLEQASTRGDQAEVARLLSQIPASAADDNRVWYYKGWLHSARDELEQAEASYRKSLELFPYAWRSQFDLANVLRRLNRFDDVDRLNQLSLEGKQIREQVLQLPDVQAVPVDLFRKMQAYADACGDPITAARMAERLSNLESISAPPQG